jgi:hypothetical protein
MSKLLKRNQLNPLSFGMKHATLAAAPLQDRAIQIGIADCYDQGLVKAIGVSNFGNKELRLVPRATSCILLCNPAALPVVIWETFCMPTNPIS